MTTSDLQLHIRYSAWASRQLMDAVRALPPAEIEKPTGISHGSILGTMAHLHFADWIWYTRVAEAIDKPAATMASLENEWPDLQARWERFVDALSDADLARAIPYRSIRGYDAVATVEQVVLHLVNHGTLHRGQVMGMIRQLGIEPPGTDLMHFYMTVAAGSGLRAQGLGTCEVRYWWVNQDHTFREETRKHFMWSPKQKADGARNQEFEAESYQALAARERHRTTLAEP